MASSSEESLFCNTVISVLQEVGDMRFLPFTINKNSKLWNRYLTKIHQQIQQFYNSRALFYTGTGINQVTKSLLMAMYYIREDTDPPPFLFKIDGIKKQPSYSSRISLTFYLLVYLCDVDSCLYLSENDLEISKEFNDAFRQYVQQLTVEQIDHYVKKALDIVCRERVYQMCLEHKDITENNFITLCTPLSSQKDYKEIQTMIRKMNALIADFVALSVCQNGNFDKDTIQFKELSDELQNKLTQIQAKFEQANDRIAVLEKQNDDISTKLSQAKSQLDVYLRGKVRTHDEYQELQQRYQELSQKYNKLKRLYDSLNDKYESLKGSLNDTSESQPETNPSDTKEIKIDFNKQYIFACLDQTNFQQNLKEVFPNASFITSPRDPLPAKYDAVIAITSYIRHELYFHLKTRCESRGIPFIHCQNTNINLIIETIAKVIKE